MARSAPLPMPDDLRDTLLETLESALDAQLRAVRRLRAQPAPGPKRLSPQSMSQVDMTYDILASAERPLHIAELIEGVQAKFSRAVDRESLVSALSKKIARGDRFVRTGKNTFAVRGPD